MQIRVYIDPNGDVTITTLMADLVPVAFSLDQADQQMQCWLDFLSEMGSCRLLDFRQAGQSESRSVHQRASTPKQ
jgi:hypothetical protein